MTADACDLQSELQPNVSISVEWTAIEPFKEYPHGQTQIPHALKGGKRNNIHKEQVDPLQSGPKQKKGPLSPLIALLSGS
jgi:hypothetical protein